MESEKEIQELTFTQIEREIHEGLTASYAFLRDGLATGNFEETQKLHTGMMNAVSKWLIHVKKKMTNGKSETSQ